MKQWNSIRWQLPLSYSFIALLVAVSLGSVMMLVLRSYYARQEREHMRGNALVLAPLLEQILQTDFSSQILQDQITSLSFLSRAQIRVLDNYGKLISDSGIPDLSQTVALSTAPQGMVMFSVPLQIPAGETSAFIYNFENGEYIDPEILPFEHEIKPTDGDIFIPLISSPYGYGFSETQSYNSTKHSLEVVSIELIDNSGKPLGLLEFSNGPSYGTDIIYSVTLSWLIASLFSIVIAAFTGWFISKRVTQPVLILEDATRKMKNGNLTVRVQLPNEKQDEFLSLANSFNGMAVQVESTISTLRAFIADAAHELHTPLTALQTNLELAKDEKHASSLDLYLTRATEQTQRLESLVKSLLDLSRLESVELESKFELVNLSQLIHEVAEQFASRAEQFNRFFKLDVSDEKIELMGDEMRLRQVLTNLLENSIKFTQENDAISLSAQAIDDKVQIKISDTGIGIPNEDLPDLFKRFHRGRNVSEYAGNGLGLAIVKAIVDAHHGDVSVQSEGIDLGSEFVITLTAL